MTDPWLNRWNERYSKEEFAYGTEPNVYFKEQIDKLEAGSILCAADGEGRNGVYAATQGWKVAAFDISIEAKKKAMRLAETNHVTIDYQIGELPTLEFKPEQFDVLALIFAHFPTAIKSGYHQLLSTFVRKGGVVIFEAFSKNHLQYNSNNETVGGPKDIDQLFSIEEIQADFPNYDIIELEEKVLYLEEGPFHSGKGSVIRFIGKKN